MFRFISKLTSLLLLLSPMLLTGQTDGDYRTNFSGLSGVWTNLAIWERYDGISSSWKPADAFPTKSANTITVSAGDSVQITSGVAFEVDQLTIENTASLLIFSQTVLLANGPGDDIQVYGKLYVASSGYLTTTPLDPAMVNVRPNGYMQLRNGAVIESTVNNYGLMEANLFTMRNGAIIRNYQKFNFINGTTPGAPYNPVIDNATFINESEVFINATGTVLLSGSVSPNNHFINEVGASLIHNVNSGTFGTNNNGAGIKVTNRGILRGTGTFNFNNAPGSFTGPAPGNLTMIDPGTTSNTGILAVNGYLVRPEIGITIDIGTSTTPGSGHDQLIANGSITFNGTKLVIKDKGSATPLGVYTIITTTGVVNGFLTNIEKPDTYGPITVINNNTVQIEKLTLVPLTWGYLVANVESSDAVSISWSTLQESNTSHFNVFTSLDGVNFSKISTLKAGGNTNSEKRYSYLHSSPSSNSVNYYRLEQVDLDGKSSLSKIVSVKRNNSDKLAISVLGNPSRNTIHLLAHESDIWVRLVGIDGKSSETKRLAKGYNQIDANRFTSGLHQIIVYKDGAIVQTEKVMIIK